MALLVLTIASAVLAAIPAVIFTANLRHFRPPGAPETTGRPYLSVLIPARNEEESIAAAVTSALASEGVDLEVIVLDDHSQDRTGEIVRGMADNDDRVRLESAPALPQGWCGKQHACHVLAGLASHDLLVFMDADVRVAPHALARAVAFLKRSGADLVSGFPRELTGTFSEQLVIPLIHFILLGFLPIWRMRSSGSPSLAAGCGQWFIARRSAYRQSWGHKAIKASRHDGIMLPRAVRRAGLKTDIFDATQLAECRMYRGFRQVWNGLAKNATEGLASPVNLIVFTVLLGVGQALPLFLLVASLMAGHAAAAALSLLALLLSLWPRLIAVGRFRQPVLGALLHPAGVAILLGIQWYAFLRQIAGRPIAWKGRF